MYQTGASATYGSVIGVGREVFNRLAIRLDNLTGTDYPPVKAYGIGFGITCLLSLIRHRFFWWPFHPIGYVMVTYGGFSEFWSSVFLGWLIKVIIVNFFGLKANRQAVPFFMGLILGDYVVSSLWTLVGTIFNIPTYVLWTP